MNLVGKVLWFIESHFVEEISLEDVAAAGDVSRFHMSRAFGLASFSNGDAVCARPPADRGAARSPFARRASISWYPPLDAGYGSHEAFTRAFRDQFGVTPDAVRLHGRVDNLKLVEPIRMSENAKNVGLERNRAAKPVRALLIAGLRVRYSRRRSPDPHAMAALPAPYRRHAGTDRRQGVWRLLRFRPDGPFRLCMRRRRLRRRGVAARTEHAFAFRQTFAGVPPSRACLGHPCDVAGDHGRLVSRRRARRSPMQPNFGLYAEDFDGRTGLRQHLKIWVPIVE